MVKLLLIELLSFAAVVMCAYRLASSAPTMIDREQKDRAVLAKKLKLYNQQTKYEEDSLYQELTHKIDTIMTDLGKRSVSMLQHQKVIDHHHKMTDLFNKSGVTLRYNHVYFMVDALLPVLAHLERLEHYHSVARELRDEILKLQKELEKLNRRCMWDNLDYQPEKFEIFVETFDVPHMNSYSIAEWEQFFDGQYEYFVLNMVPSAQKALNNAKSIDMYAKLALLVRYKIYLRYIEQLIGEVNMECSAEALDEKYGWFEIPARILHEVVVNANVPSSNWIDKYDALRQEAYSAVCSCFNMNMRDMNDESNKFARTCNYARYLDDNSSMPLWDAFMMIFSENTMRPTLMDKLHESYEDYVVKAQDKVNEREDDKIRHITDQVSRDFQNELDNLRQDNIQFRYERKIMMQELAQLRSKQSKPTGQQQAMENDLIQLKSENASIRSQYEAVHEELNNQMKKIKLEYNGLEKHYEETVKKYKSQLAHLESELSKPTEQQQAMENELIRLKSENVNIRSQYEAVHEELNNQMKQRGLEIEGLEKHYEERIQTYENELAQLKSELPKPTKQQSAAEKLAQLKSGNAGIRGQYETESDKLKNQRDETVRQSENFLKEEREGRMKSSQKSGPSVHQS